MRGQHDEKGAADVTIKIPRPLYENLRTVIQGTGFKSVTEFVVHVLRDVTSMQREKRDAQALSEDEIRLIRGRLKSLGYL